MDFRDARDFELILLGQQDADFTDAVTEGAGDFFWSTSNLNEGAVNGPIDLTLNPGESTTLFLYYSTNGPTGTDIRNGYALNVATSQSGVIRFTGAETLNPSSDFGSRWDYPQADGPAQSVGSDLITGLTAMRDLVGSGLSQAQAPFDGGYDSTAQAFLCGSIELEAIAPGTIELAFGPNDLGISNFMAPDDIDDPDEAFSFYKDPNENTLLQLTFAQANITVAGDVGLLGDVNMSGNVDFLDISPFIAVLSANGSFQVEADCNEDGTVDFLDIAPFIWNSKCSALLSTSYLKVRQNSAVLVFWTS